MSNRILIVDDEIEIADLVALYLKNEGYHVLSCYKAADALKYIQEETLDLAILDKTVTYHERLKESYYILQEYWADLDS